MVDLRGPWSLAGAWSAVSAIPSDLNGVELFFIGTDFGDGGMMSVRLF